MFRIFSGTLAQDSRFPDRVESGAAIPELQDPYYEKIGL